jgi:uncharacterized protein involved in exopolysaccharide biosynthesis
MNANQNLYLTPADVVDLLRRHWRRWVIPTLLGGLVGTLYAAVRPDRWEAAQALLIRNEAANNADGPGKFRQIDDMKVVQETVLELAKSRKVLEHALTQTGPPPGTSSKQPWPTPTAVDELRKHIKVAPPKGAEFGKTQLFYLKVTDEDRLRAVALASAICDALQSEFQTVLNKQAESMVTELTNNVTLAQQNVNDTTARLAELEHQVGTDLAELRILQANPAASSELRQRVVFLEGELRRIQTQQTTNKELQRLLHSAIDDTQNLIAAPNSLLESQPALKRLKEGLIDAQLKTSQLLGGMTEEHPQVKAAMESERAVRNDIRAELAIAIRGLESDSRLLLGQADVFKNQLAETNARLERIAQLRTQYSNLVANVEHANTLLQTAEKNLADARAKQVAALEASLIERIDTPDTGLKPIGPGRAVIALGGLVGGLLAGLGIVVLSVPLPKRPDEPLSTVARDVVEHPRSAPESGPPARAAVVGKVAPSPLKKPARRTSPVPRAALQNLSLKQALSRVATPAPQADVDSPPQPRAGGAGNSSRYAGTTQP